MIRHERIGCGHERRGVGSFDEPDAARLLERAEAAPPVDAVVVARIGIERPIVQLDDYRQPGVRQGADDGFTREVKRRRRRVGWRVQDGRALRLQAQRSPDRITGPSAVCEPIELWIADERRLRGRDDAGSEIARHAVAVDERHAVVQLVSHRQT